MTVLHVVSIKGISSKYANEIIENCKNNACVDWSAHDEIGEFTCYRFADNSHIDVLIFRYGGINISIYGKDKYVGTFYASK